MQKFLLSCLMLAGAGMSVTVQADTENADQEVTLPEIVVTATRTETNKNELAVATTIITREDIDKQQVKTLRIF